MFALDPSVKRPLLAIVIPPLVFDTVLLKVIAAPVRLIPAVVVTAPLNVVVPVPAFWVIEAAEKLDDAPMFLALLMVTAPKGVEPTVEEKRISPPPAVRLRV